MKAHVLLRDPEDEHQQKRWASWISYCLDLSAFLDEHVSAYDAFDVFDDATAEYGCLLYPDGGNEVSEKVPRPIRYYIYQPRVNTEPHEP